MWGLLAFRLANADALPFDFAAYGDKIREFVADLDKNGKVQQNVDLASLYTKIAEFEKTGAELNAAVAAAITSGKLTPARAHKLNAGIMQVESNWLTADGIPGRPWFKHLLYAARYTYAHLELPGLTEAAEQADWQTAKAQVVLLELAIEKNIRLLRDTLADLKTNK